MRLRAAVVAVPALAGCGIVVKAFTVPYAELCDAGNCTTNHLPTLLNGVNYELSGVVVVPAAAVAVAVVAVASFAFARRPNLSAVAAWSLSAAGVVCVIFFAILQGVYQGGRWGALLGLLGSFLIVVAGVGAAAALRSPHQRV